MWNNILIYNKLYTYNMTKEKNKNWLQYCYMSLSRPLTRGQNSSPAIWSATSCKFHVDHHYFSFHLKVIFMIISPPILGTRKRNDNPQFTTISLFFFAFLFFRGCRRTLFPAAAPSAPVRAIGRIARSSRLHRQQPRLLRVELQCDEWWVLSLCFYRVTLQ